MVNGHRLIAILLIGLGSIGISVTSAAIADSTTPQKVAFVGFRIINEAMEPISEAEKKRAKLLDLIFVVQLQKTGQFELVPIQKAIAEEIDKGPFIGECNGCEIDYGKNVRVDLSAWGTIQTVSNLILNLNVYMESIQSRQLTYIKSIDIRGNNDRSWTKGLEWMLKYYMLGQDKE